MKMYVEAIDEIGERVWLKIVSGEKEPTILLDFEPDPFSRVTNIYEGDKIEIEGIEYEIVGKTAYTRRW